MKVCSTCGEAHGDEHARCPRDGSPLRTMQDPLMGRTVGGRYRLISRLGSGGMSAVHLARHVLVERLVAVKTLRRDLAQSPAQRDRFIREARAVNRVNHENIVEITDFGQTDDRLVYLVMEYVAGRSLLRVIGDEAPFEPFRALHIAEQTASALGRAHQMGIVHRDLKPENILLTRRGDDDDFVKLLDFGIAKILDAPSLTASQQIFGTPGYIAPEYIQSTSIDGRADLYSLGVLLYEMVTGSLPFDYEYPGDLLVKHVTEPPIAPSRRDPSVPPALEALVLRALEKEPSRRFRDAYHFLEELRRVREHVGGPKSRGGPLSCGDPRNEPTADESAILTEHVSHTIHRAPPLSTDPALLAPEAPLGDQAGVALVVPRRDEERRRGHADTDDHVVLEPSPVALGLASSDPEMLRVGRWRARFDMLAAAVTLLSCKDPSVLDDLAFSREALASLESGVATAEAAQRELDQLYDEARDYRRGLGCAVDQRAIQHSKARGQLEGLARRREALLSACEVESAHVRGEPGAPTLGALPELEQALRACALEIEELESQLATLRAQLERHNEALEARQTLLVSTADAEMNRLDALTAALRLPLERVQQWVESATNAHPTSEHPTSEHPTRTRTS